MGHTIDVAAFLPRWWPYTQINIPHHADSQPIQEYLQGLTTSSRNMRLDVGFLEAAQ